MDRDKIQEKLVEQIIDDMDLKTMAVFCHDCLNDSYNRYSKEQLIQEIEEYYPDILND
tara:strand:- start:226 stop:399 length:174 start_codon:yes stop_codon:yes gene_type:complete